MNSISDINNKIKNALTYIKDNPDCDNKNANLDGHLIKDLHEQGLLRGSDITPLSEKSPSYVALRITLSGEQHLAAL